MTAFLMVIHTLVCIFLSAVILMQSGRGGGLTEGFAPAESLFGAKTNAFMVRTTTFAAVAFITTCLVLAYLSSKREQSLMEKIPEKKPAVEKNALPAPSPATADPAAPSN